MGRRGRLSHPRRRPSHPTAPLAPSPHSAFPTTQFSMVPSVARACSGGSAGGAFRAGTPDDSAADEPLTVSFELQGGNDAVPHTALPPWQAAITLRGFLVAAALGVVFCIITMKLNFGSAGINPSLTIPGGLLSFILLKTLTRIGSRLGLGWRLFGDFTPQENAVVQTMTSSCYNIAGYAGFGSYLLAMSRQAYINTGGVPEGQPGYNAAEIYDPLLSRIYPYLALISFAGIFILVALRNLMIMTWRLPYPSGTASGAMIESLHSPAGEGAARQKVALMGYTAAASFVFDLSKWFWQGRDYSCGFMVWPNLGPQALRWTWNFDAQQQYIGAGMLVPPIVAWSMLLGGVLSWGLMWPLLERRAGDWYPTGLRSNDFKGLFGYKVWLTIALLLGEGLYMLAKAFVLGVQHFRTSRRGPQLPSNCKDPGATPQSKEAVAGISFIETEEERAEREAVFRAGQIPLWVTPVGYCVFAAAGTVGIPFLYPPARWYFVLCAYAIAPFIALPNSYGAGLTDQDQCSMYAKLALFVFAAWAGKAGNGVIAGCSIAGVIMVSTTSAAVLMQDMRTAYITRTPPQAMLAAQVIGTALGVLLTPLAFELFWRTGLVGRPDGPHPNPFANIYRGMAIIGTEGFAALPQYCVVLSVAFFVAALGICLARDLLPARLGRFVPSPMGMGFSFYIGANNALDFWLGTLVMHVWQRVSPDKAVELGPLAGAGLIVGDGIFAIPAALLAIGNVAPPICMKFV